MGQKSSKRSSPLVQESELPPVRCQKRRKIKVSRERSRDQRRGVSNNILNNVACTHNSETPTNSLPRRKLSPDVVPITEPEWDRGMTVALPPSGNKIDPNGITPASNPGRFHNRTTPMQSLYRADSFSQSLHKDMQYPAINVSRKSPPSSQEDSAQNDPFYQSRRRRNLAFDPRRSYTPIRPDRIYPNQTPTLPKQRLSPSKVNVEPGTKKKKKGKENSDSKTVTPETKQLNTPVSSNDISATVGRGWYSCFKNKNYLFVRNSGGSYYHKPNEEEEESPWYKSYDILESKYHIGIGAKGKALDFSEPRSSSTAKNAPENSPFADLSVLIVDKETCQISETMPKSSISSTSSGKPSPANNTNSEERLIDYQQNDDAKRHRNQRKGPASWLRKLRTPRKTPMKLPSEFRPYNGPSSPYRTPRSRALRKTPDDVQTNGPHTSTPRDSAENLLYASSRQTPNGGFTPRRGYEKNGGPSVRRRLPYTPVKGKEDKNLDLMSLSPSEPPRREKRTSKESLDLISWDNVPIKENRPFRETLPRARKNASLPEVNFKTKQSRNGSGTLPLKKDTSISAPNFEYPERRRSHPAMYQTPTRDEWEANENESWNKEIRNQSSIELIFKNNVTNDLIDISVALLPPDLKILAIAQIPINAEIAISYGLKMAVIFKRKSPKNKTTEDKPQDLLETEDGPVTSWLKEVRMMTEGECLNALQAKVIAKKDQALLSSVAVGNAQEATERIWDSGIRVLEHLQLSKRILVQHYDHPDSSPSGRWSSFCSQLDRFCAALREFLKRKSPNLSPKPSTSSTDDVTTDSGIDEDCGEIFNVVNSGKCLMDQPGWKEKTLLEMDASERSFRRLMEKLALQQIVVIIKQLEEGTSDISIKRALYAIILLGKQFGPDLCKLLAEADVVRALLTVCLDKKWCSLFACALRALTVVCSSSEAVRQLKQCGGMECIGDILCDNQIDEKTKGEAAGLLAQITAPWTESSSKLLSDPTFRNVGSQLIEALTDLAESTENNEVFLLAVAAIANISFCEEAAKFWIPQHQTLQTLNDCRNGKDVARSLFAIDQISTVFANCASHTEGRQQIMLKVEANAGQSSSSSLVSLLCFLKVRTRQGHSKAEIAACERIQQKAAVAIARLCGDLDAVNAIADMQGIQCLVKMCKDKKERNNSDSVLVACLAAVKKIATIRGDEEVRKLGAGDLVDQSLWEAFIAHSAKNESYV